MLGGFLGVTGGNYVEADLKDSTESAAVANLSLWLKNDTGVTAAKWTDSSGNNNHATQSTEGNQATVSGGGLDFEADDSTHYDLTSTITIAENQGFCIAVVVDQETVGDNMILSKDSNDHIKIADANTFRIIANDDTQTQTNFRFVGNEFAAGSKMLILVNRSAGAANKFTFFKNGTQLTPNTDTSTNEAEGENPYGFDINVLGARAGTSQFFDGKILELAFWIRSLTTQEITDVNEYLKEIHGL
jgi:hypothetical protein